MDTNKGVISIMDTVDAKCTKEFPCVCRAQNQPLPFRTKEMCESQNGVWKKRWTQKKGNPVMPENLHDTFPKIQWQHACTDTYHTVEGPAFGNTYSSYNDWRTKGSILNEHTGKIVACESMTNKKFNHLTGRCDSTDGNLSDHVKDRIDKSHGIYSAAIGGCPEITNENKCKLNTSCKWRKNRGGTYACRNNNAAFWANCPIREADNCPSQCDKTDDKCDFYPPDAETGKYNEMWSKTTNWARTAPGITRGKDKMGCNPNGDPTKSESGVYCGTPDQIKYQSGVPSGSKHFCPHGFTGKWNGSSIDYRCCGPKETCTNTGAGPEMPCVLRDHSCENMRKEKCEQSTTCKIDPTFKTCVSKFYGDALPKDKMYKLSYLLHWRASSPSCSACPYGHINKDDWSYCCKQEEECNKGVAPATANDWNGICTNMWRRGGDERERLCINCPYGHVQRGMEEFCCREGELGCYTGDGGNVLSV